MSGERYRLTWASSYCLNLLDFFGKIYICKSSEKSIPKTLKFTWDQFSFIFGQIIWSEYFLFPTHTAFVLDEFFIYSLVYTG
jgi:hypothetical protein